VCGQGGGGKGAEWRLRGGGRGGGVGGAVGVGECGVRNGRWSTGANVLSKEIL